MNNFQKCIFCFIFLISTIGLVQPLFSIILTETGRLSNYGGVYYQNYPSYYSSYPNYYGYNNPSDYYYYNYYPSYGYNSSYYGFYGSPPPPTYYQAFPDEARADALYRYLQHR